MGLIDNEFIYGGKSSAEFGIYCSGAETYSAPIRRYSKIEIPGKDGDVLEDGNTFANAPLTYKCIIIGDLDNYERFKAFMMSNKGYKRLEDTFHPDEYRMAVLSESISPVIKGDYDTASFSISFSALPQRFLKSGETFISLSSGNNILINNTYNISKPTIRMYGSGSLVIGNKSFAISNVDGYVDIDCEEMDVYKGSINMNRYFTGDFPELNPGENIIVNSVAIDIKPRWYTI